MAVTKRIVLRFPKRMVERPIIYRLVKDYDLEFNILKASITPEQEGLLRDSMECPEEIMYAELTAGLSVHSGPGFIGLSFVLEE